MCSSCRRRRGVAVAVIEDQSLRSLPFGTLLARYEGVDWKRLEVSVEPPSARSDHWARWSSLFEDDFRWADIVSAYRQRDATCHPPREPVELDAAGSALVMCRPAERRAGLHEPV